MKQIRGWLELKDPNGILFKGETLLWGYRVKHSAAKSESGKKLTLHTVVTSRGKLFGVIYGEKISFSMPIPKARGMLNAIKRTCNNVGAKGFARWSCTFTTKDLVR